MDGKFSILNFVIHDFDAKFSISCCEQLWNLTGVQDGFGNNLIRRG